MDKPIDKSVEFEIVTTCAGIDFAYRAGTTVTLGETITEETARDLLRAGFIKKVESVERATATPVTETATKKLKPVRDERPVVRGQE